MRRFLALLLAATAVAVVVPTLGASAGPLPPSDNLDVGLVSDTEPLVFAAFVDDEITCDTVTVVEVLANGDPIQPLSVVPDETESNLVYIVLPSATPPGVLEVAVECLEGEFPSDYSGGTEWAAIGVTKVVDGPAPEGTEFTVEVECFADRIRSNGFLVPQGATETVVHELGYTMSGEVHYVYFDNENECTITEPGNGGAIATTITPEVVEVTDAVLFPVTVTNTFAAAVEPTFTG